MVETQGRPPGSITPLLDFGYQFDPEIRVWVKDESRNPTGTFKDRLASALVYQIIARDASSDHNLLISCITLGNTMRSVGYFITTAISAAVRPQLLGLFPQGFSDRRIGPDSSGRTISGADVLTECTSLGVRCEEVDLKSAYLQETDIGEIASGLKISFEHHRDISYGIGEQAYAQVLAEAIAGMDEIPDYVYVPVGAGVLFDECVDMVERHGWKSIVVGISVLREESVADKIYGYYSPYFDELRRMGRSHHWRHPRHPVIPVTDDQILAALQALSRTGPIDVEPSAAAAFVPLINGETYAQCLPRDGGAALVINTGNGCRGTQR